MFYGHLERMDPKRLTQRIHSSISKKSLYAKWANQVQKDLDETQIRKDLVWNRNQFKDAVKSTNKLKPLTSVRARPNARWSQDRKNDHSSRMKIYWYKKKKTK